MNFIQEDWIELQTRKYGTVLFNKQTGEVATSPDPGPGTAPATASGQREDVVQTSAAAMTVSRSKKKAKKAERDGTVGHHHRGDQEPASGEEREGDGARDGDHEVETPQPALRKRKVYIIIYLS